MLLNCTVGRPIRLTLYRLFEARVQRVETTLFSVFSSSTSGWTRWTSDSLDQNDSSVNGFYPLIKRFVMPCKPFFVRYKGLQQRMAPKQDSIGGIGFGLLCTIEGCQRELMTSSVMSDV